MGLPGGASLFLRAPLAASSISWHKIPQLFLSTERRSSALAPALRTALGALPASGWSRRGFSVVKSEKGRGVGAIRMDSSGCDGAIASQKNSLSPASAIQFLTLIQRLKVCCVFFPH